jgi:RNA polymerase sigma-70 factor (ECF subfamily)
VRDSERLAEQFEDNRGHLTAVAYRMLGSLAEADDAVQEAWLRLHRADTTEVANLGGWLTTVVAHVCLDMLRSRRSRREEPLDEHVPEPVGGPAPEREAELADSVGLALLVVLDTLDPAERLAFVLHDMFAVPFDEIAPVVGRSSAAARQLASRARRRVQGADVRTDADLARQRAVVSAFLAAARGGDFAALLAVLDPDVVARTDAAGVVVRGAAQVARAARVAAAARAEVSQLALVDGAVGVVVAPAGRLTLALLFTVVGDRITALTTVTDPDRLHELDIAVLPD